MSPFCSVDTGGNHLIDMLVLVNVTTVKFCGGELGTEEKYIITSPGANYNCNLL